MDSLNYQIDEIYNEAIITGIPAIIVEGIDDITIYERLADNATLNVEIYAVENIEGFAEGCDQVIKAIEELNTLEGTKYKLVNHVLGVIDKDVRDFRKELPEIEPILVLNYYSIESHFVAQSVVKHILKLCSKASRDLITDDLCTAIMDEIETRLLDLYYFSLESLKKSLTPDYDSDFSYSYACGRMNDAVIKRSLEEKRDSLDRFASEHGLTPCLDVIKSISKGKWLIDVFASEILNCINTLQQKCQDKHITMCKSCISGAYEKCLYRINEGFTKRSIKSLALTDTDFQEFDYIRQRIASIKEDQ
ncbi:hypothetical protein [Shewanella algae]|uniref:hypothetical protein n=1 Tax=Shewanella algae TaxID=38313 RepID=UPI003AAE4BB3